MSGIPTCYTTIPSITIKTTAATTDRRLHQDLEYPEKAYAGQVNEYLEIASPTVLGEPPDAARSFSSQSTPFTLYHECAFLAPALARNLSRRGCVSLIYPTRVRGESLLGKLCDDV